MKKLLLALMLIPSVMMAQNTEKAKGILNKVSSKTKTFSTIKADFSFQMKNEEEDINETYDGTILIKGAKYKASLMNVDTYFDGKTLWTYMIDSEEVNVDEPDPNDGETLNPASIFTIYKKGFKYAYKGEEIVKGKKLNVIDLYPTDKEKPYSKVTLKIQESNNDIYSIKQYGKDGNSYIITVKKMVTNLPISDKTFVFDTAANPKVDVIDMR